jgi:hypothetical protein
MQNYGGKTKRILKLAHESGIMSSAEARSQGIHHEYLRQLCREGKLMRVGRGLYSHSENSLPRRENLF